MLTLTNEPLDRLCQRIPDSPRSPKGGRPPLETRKAIQGIFWILDNGVKWKDLPSKFGSKSAVHRWFQTWVRDGVFEKIMRDASRCVVERDGYRSYECYIDGTFSKAKGGDDGIGCTKVGKGVKIMVLVDARGLPVAVDTADMNNRSAPIAYSDNVQVAPLHAAEDLQPSHIREAASPFVIFKIGPITEPCIVPIDQTIVKPVHCEQSLHHRAGWLKSPAESLPAHPVSLGTEICNDRCGRI